jgi:inosine-uridine nucleoside N-ribohydrolase
MPEKVILDCDNTMGLPLHEVDDGLALLYLLGKPDIDLLGVTTTFGNGPLKQVLHQTVKLMADLRIELDVYEGEDRKNKGKETPAARYLVGQAQKWGKDLTIIATGPLGNLATASRLDPAFFTRIKQIICMGGKVHQLKIGWRDLFELNFSANPQAAYTVLTAPCAVTVMSSHICTQASIDRHLIDQLTFWPPNFRRMLKRWLLAFGAYCGTKVFYLWDLLPVVFLTNPELFEVASVHLASVVDDLQKGRLVTTKNPQYPRVNFPINIVDKEGFYKVLIAGWENSAKAYPFKGY